MNSKHGKKGLKKFEHLLLDVIFSGVIILLLLFFVKQAGSVKTHDNPKRDESSANDLLETKENEQRSKVQAADKKLVQSIEEPNKADDKIPDDKSKSEKPRQDQPELSGEDRSEDGDEDQIEKSKEDQLEQRGKDRSGKRDEDHSGKNNGEKSGETQPGATKAQKRLININQADEEELKELNGIGDELARRIVEYRTKHGEFKKISDLKRVSGIGEKKFNKIKNSICVK